MRVLTHSFSFDIMLLGFEEQALSWGGGAALTGMVED